MGFKSRFITCMPKGEKFDDCHVITGQTEREVTLRLPLYYSIDLSRYLIIMYQIKNTIK